MDSPKPRHPPCPQRRNSCPLPEMSENPMPHGTGVYDLKCGCGAHFKVLAVGPLTLIIRPEEYVGPPTEKAEPQTGTT